MANEPLDLVSLIARLRSAGLRTDIRQYLAAHELLLAMAGQGRALQDDAEALASHLGPIFCGSPEEQQLFRHEVLAWRGEPRATPPAPQPVIHKSRLRAWLLTGCVTVAVIGIGGVLWWINHPDPAPLPEPPPPVEPAPKSVDQPPPPKSSFVVSKPTVVLSDDVPVEAPWEVSVPWPTIAAGGLGAALLTFLALWWRQKARRDFVLSRMAPDPDTKRIELNPTPPGLTNIRPLALRRISAGLRRTRANEVLDLSVTATVNATANAGGFVVPVFAPRVAIPEYLVLIDRRSESDHSAQLIYGWVKQLSDQGVAADCYEFDSDPRVCREFGTQRSHRLPALLARHHRATVLLCAESDVCMDAMTNKPQPWLRSFNSLPSRVFLSLAPPYRWSGQEQRLVDAGFVVVPATPTGLHIAASMDRNSMEAIGIGAKYAREFPRLIAQDNLRWLDRNPPPEVTVSRLLRALHDFLGPDGYAWLCACAVYPQVSWPITLKLLDALLSSGMEIPARRAIDEQLPAIARLPWFRYGYMPDWLRKLLIAHLDPEKEARIRATLEQLVCGLLDGKEAGDSGTRDADSSKLGIRVRPKALEVARAAPVSSPLQDEVFLDFLAGASPDPLSLRLSSLAFTGAPRPRSMGTRMRERWRALGVRQPMLMRSVISFLVAVPVTVILWAALRDLPQAIEVPDSDITYYLASSDLSSSQTLVAVAPNGQFMLLASPKAGNFVEVWDLVRNEVRGRLTTQAPPRLLVISPRSDRIGVLDERGLLYQSDFSFKDEPTRIPSATTDRPSLPKDGSITLKFSADSSLLLLYGGAGIATFYTEPFAILARSTTLITGATFARNIPHRVMAVTDGRLREFDASLSRRAGVDRPLRANKVEFSLDGRNLARVTLLPQNREFQVELQDTFTGAIRAEIPPTPEPPPLGWVWSGDGNLVAYNQMTNTEGRSRNTIYDIPSKQLLATQESRLPATNRLYTIRFARSAQRRPNYNYYEIAERSIDVVPSPEPIQPAAAPDPAPTTPPGNETPRIPTPDEIAKQNESVLYRLDPEVGARARQLIDMARKEGITVRVTSGRGQHRYPRGHTRDMHKAGRAFDVAVLTDDGKWSTTDISRLMLIGKAGKSLGLTWSGDWGYKEFSHFELPAKNAGPARAAEPPAQTNQAPAEADQTAQTTKDPAQTATPSENAPASADEILRFEKTEFEFPRDRDTQEDLRRAREVSGNPENSYSAAIRTVEGLRAGLIAVQLERINPRENDSIGQVVLAGYGITNIIQLIPPETSPSELANAEVTITAQEFEKGNVTTKAMNVGLLRITLSLEGSKVRRSAGSPVFDRRSLRIRVRVQLQSGGYERSRAPAKSS